MSQSYHPLFFSVLFMNSSLLINDHRCNKRIKVGGMQYKIDQAPPLSLMLCPRFLTGGKSSRWPSSGTNEIEATQLLVPGMTTLCSLRLGKENRLILQCGPSFASIMRKTSNKKETAGGDQESGLFVRLPLLQAGRNHSVERNEEEHELHWLWAKTGTTSEVFTAILQH